MISLCTDSQCRSACMRMCNQRNTSNRHPSRSHLDWLLPSLHRWLPDDFPTGPAGCLCVCVMSLWRTSSTLQPGIISFEAQLTLKVQLQQRALWQSRVKYFYAVALDDRETHLLICSSKRPQGKLGSWVGKGVILWDIGSMYRAKNQTLMRSYLSLLLQLFCTICTSLQWPWPDSLL